MTSMEGVLCPTVTKTGTLKKPEVSGDAEVFDKVGAPGRDRTCDNQLRRLVLYPTELRAHHLIFNHLRILFFNHRFRASHFRGHFSGRPQTPTMIDRHTTTRALTSCSILENRPSYAPSQKGFVADCPQRHKATVSVGIETIL